VRRLSGSSSRARAVNAVALWRDLIAVEAFRGREQRISEMYEYACATRLRNLRRALAEDAYLCAESLQRDYLGGPGLISQMMVATFFLVGLDNAYRLLLWFCSQEVGNTMFPRYPRFAPEALAAAPDVSDPAVTEVSEMPLVRDADDFRAMITRLRVVLDDPRQLLSGCVTNFVLAQLVEHDNDPTQVTVLGTRSPRFIGILHVFGRVPRSCPSPRRRPVGMKMSASALASSRDGYFQISSAEKPIFARE
jgi:Domain of unknown function (DUF5624)